MEEALWGGERWAVGRACPLIWSRLKASLVARSNAFPLKGFNINLISKETEN